MKKIYIGIIILVLAVLVISLLNRTDNNEVQDTSRTSVYSDISPATSNDDQGKLTVSFSEEDQAVLVVSEFAYGNKINQTGTWSQQGEDLVKVELSSSNEQQLDEPIVIVYQTGRGGTLTAVEYEDSVYGPAGIILESQTGLTVDDFFTQEKTEESATDDNNILAPENEDSTPTPAEPEETDSSINTQPSTTFELETT